jgi:hypothetical protein
MKKIIITGIIFILALLNYNCGGSKEIIEIKPRVIYPPVIEDTLKVSNKSDSVIVGAIFDSGHATSLQKDTTIIVKYFPKEEKFYVKVKPDSIVIMDTIRTVQIKEKNIETPFLSKMGLIMIGIIITVIGMYLLGKRG